MTYYDPPDSFADAVADLCDRLGECMKQYPVSDPHEYDEEYREASCAIESIALMILDDFDLHQRVMSHLRWIEQGKPKRVNVYEEASDLL